MRVRRRRRSKSPQLPDELVRVIDGITVVERPSLAGDPDARTILFEPTLGSWYHDHENTAERLRRVFPDINEAQVERATKLIFNAGRRQKRNLLRDQRRRNRARPRSLDPDFPI